MKDSDENKYRFYEGYEPVENVSKRLNPPNEDYHLSAPYRDILGILESKGATTQETAIPAKEILNELKEWEEKRKRAEEPPANTKRIKEQSRELYEDGLLMIMEQEGKKNYYWKIPDEGVPDPNLFKITKRARLFTRYLDGIFCRHEGALIGVFIYITGSVVHHFHPIGSDISIVGILIFLIGHLLAYRGVDLIP